MVSGAGPIAGRPVIGVTGNDRWLSPSWQCIRLAVLMAGGDPRRVSTSRELPTAEMDGLIVSGGDDIHPTLYGEEPAPDVFYDVERDEMEERYISVALDRGLPVLGICRGYQLINVLLGGSLYLDIRDLRNLTLNRRGLLATKNVRIETGSKLADVLAGDHIMVNSLHFQAIDRVADELMAAAWDRDEIIQGIEGRDRRVMGVQWHPEYLFYKGRHRGLFQWLVNEARRGAD